MYLKNVAVSNWKTFINVLVEQESTALNLRQMLIPYKLQDFESFWENFSLEIKRATRLQELVLYRCTIDVLHKCIQELPQLSILDASSIL